MGFGFGICFFGGFLGLNLGLVFVFFLGSFGFGFGICFFGFLGFGSRSRSKPKTQVFFG